MEGSHLHTMYLGLGTNLGDRLENLRLARTGLSGRMDIEACSPVYETPPWGFTEQPACLNQVLKVRTSLAPQAALDFVKGLEIQLGRQVTFKNGPRQIDIDILFYDDLVLETPTLSIPHPRMHGRGFVWLPLADLAPELYHPVIGKTVQQVLQSMDTTGIHLFAKDCLPNQSGEPADS
jgi:2-amino-4-hydroxy-6-hydroxymethyldihydropteridine diphosphokinase